MNENPPDINFYCLWCCPYAQRTWIALNELNLKYKYIEAMRFNEANEHEYIKDENLLRINPKGLVPTMEINKEVFMESIDILEHLYKQYGGEKTTHATSELVKDAQYVNKHVSSPYYKLLLMQDIADQDAAWEEFVEGLKWFTEGVQPNGFFKSTSSMNVVDMTIFPWAHRLWILEHFRQRFLDKSLPWVQDFFKWFEKMTSHESVIVTMPDKEKLMKISSKYARGTAKSQVAEAIRTGKEAHDV